jgi:hypothetical protein
MSGTMRLRPEKKIVIVICFGPMPCRVLGTISAGNHPNIFEEG